MRSLGKRPEPPGQSQTDYLRHDGAEHLAEHLRATLQSQWPGAPVKVWIEPFKTKNGQHLFAIRSDLVAGLPQSQEERLEKNLAPFE
jgi:hypothetical protein